MKRLTFFIAMTAVLAFASCNTPKTEKSATPCADTTQCDTVNLTPADTAVVTK
jgi:uncharacterized lipoprotein YajG